jgi:type II secretory pathway pseudopilin PulG
MGQQQLLLVILVTVIVGIATVVAINTFSSASKASNRDAVLNDISAIAASAQSYYTKPKMLNGGGTSFSDLTFQRIPFTGKFIDGEAEFLSAVNENGTYKLVIDAGGTKFTVTGIPSSCTSYNGSAGSLEAGTLTGVIYDTGTDDTCHFEADVFPNGIEIIKSPTTD